jgi:hypothetical protein
MAAQTFTGLVTAVAKRDEVTCNFPISRSMSAKKAVLSDWEVTRCRTQSTPIFASA